MTETPAPKDWESPSSKKIREHIINSRPEPFNRDYTEPSEIDVLLHNVAKRKTAPSALPQLKVDRSHEISIERDHNERVIDAYTHSSVLARERAIVERLNKVSQQLITLVKTLDAEDCLETCDMADDISITVYDLISEIGGKR